MSTSFVKFKLTIEKSIFHSKKETQKSFRTNISNVFITRKKIYTPLLYSNLAVVNNLVMKNELCYHHNDNHIQLEVETMMFCTKCGKQCSDSDSFCRRCGNALNTHNNTPKTIQGQHRFSSPYGTQQPYPTQPPNTFSVQQYINSQQFAPSANQNTNPQQFAPSANQNTKPQQFAPSANQNTKPQQFAPSDTQNTSPQQFAPSATQNTNPQQFAPSATQNTNPQQFAPPATQNIKQKEAVYSEQQNKNTNKLSSPEYRKNNQLNNITSDRQNIKPKSPTPSVYSHSNTKTPSDSEEEIVFYNDNFYTQPPVNKNTSDAPSKDRLRKLIIIGSISLIVVAAVVCGIIFLPGLFKNNDTSTSDNNSGESSYLQSKNSEHSETTNESSHNESSFNEKEYSDYTYESSEEESYESDITPVNGTVTYSNLMSNVFDISTYDDPDEYNFYEVTEENIRRANNAHYYLTSYELPDSTISRLKEYQINYLLNILAASNGRKFSDSDMSDFFNSLEWYADFPESYLLGKDEYSDNYTELGNTIHERMSDIEKANDNNLLNQKSKLG